MWWQSNAASHLLQVAVGIAVALVVYFVSLLLVGRRVLVSSTPDIPRDKKQEVEIVKGYMDSQNLAYTSYNTVNPFTTGKYLNLQRAHNRNGGAQFTYTFWINMTDTTEANVRGKDILLRGDIRKYNYMMRLHSGADEVGPKEDVVVKCPRIRFGRTFKDIVVEFNSLDNVMDSLFMGSNADPLDTSMRHNVMSMMQNKWAMFTFTFEDNMPINDFENGLVVRMFVNDILFFTQRKRTTLRQNNGNLYLFPSGQINGCKLGNLKYMNYAIGLDEVRKIFRQGRPKFQGDKEKSGAQSFDFNSSWSNGVDPVGGKPAYLGAYNKINLHNR